MTDYEMVFIEEKAIAIPYRGEAPRKAHDSDAGYDLVSRQSGHIMPFGRMLVACDLQVAIPEGHVGLVCPRSGLAIKYGVSVLNAPGIIDPGYQGDVGVVLQNFDPVSTYYFSRGERIAQLIIARLPLSYFHRTEEYGVWDDSERGAGGFGSTGR